MKYMPLKEYYKELDCVLDQGNKEEILGFFCRLLHG